MSAITNETLVPFVACARELALEALVSSRRFASPVSASVCAWLLRCATSPTTCAIGRARRVASAGGKRERDGRREEDEPPVPLRKRVDRGHGLDGDDGAVGSPARALRRERDPAELVRPASMPRWRADRPAGDDTPL